LTPPISTNGAALSARIVGVMAMLVMRSPLSKTSPQNAVNARCAGLYGRFT
jgi:hypothetical protein